MGDLYLERLVADLGKAEAQLRADINYRGMSFSQQRLDDSQKNVDRLHTLIRTYKAPTHKPNKKEGMDEPSKQQ